MDKSVKTALIGFLVVLIYTLFLWVDTQRWVVPFPLFSYILWVVVLAQRMGNQTHKSEFNLLLLYLSLRCLGNPFTYTFFLNETQYYAFVEGPVLSMIRILESLVVLPLIVRAIGFSNVIRRLLTIGLFVAHGLTLIPSFEAWNYGIIPLLVLVLFIVKERPIILSALVLVGLFDVLEGLSIWLG
ncbi:MAG: hypothetical protein ACO28O_02800 [Crocinitomicaceae bacterium]|jgi:hypothetical protein